MRRRGFTLIELMIVIAIIVFMAASIVGAILHAQRLAENERVQAVLTVLRTGLDRYKDDQGRYPGPPDFSLTQDPATVNNALLAELVRPRTFKDRSGLTRRLEAALELGAIETYLGDSDGNWDPEQPLLDGDDQLITGVEIIDPWTQPMYYKVPGKDHSATNSEWVDTSATYDVWSIGRNGVDDYDATDIEETDDWTNWFDRESRD
jgi:prepilin-type N-terminal cleavage/methylation domain-containing protein